jgi:hypothetical protein
VTEKLKGGEIALVGPGFRYFAKLDLSGTDKFTLLVVGQEPPRSRYFNDPDFDLKPGSASHRELCEPS